MKNEKTISVCGMGVPGTELITVSAGVGNRIIHADWLNGLCTETVGYGHNGTYIMHQYELLYYLTQRFGANRVSVIGKDAASVVFACQVDDDDYRSFGLTQSDEEEAALSKIADDARND